MTRKYEDYGVDYCSEIIISECMEYGKSSKWSGTRQGFKELTKRLLAHNIFCVDYYLGTWENITPESVGEEEYKLHVNWAKGILINY